MSTKPWLHWILILLACSVAAGQDRPHIVVFTTATCAPCQSLKRDMQASPSLAPLAASSWVSYLPPSDSRAPAYRYAGQVPLIVVLEPNGKGGYFECYRQTGYNGDAATLADNVAVRCGLLKRFCRPRNPPPKPNPGVPQPDDGQTIPIPPGGGQIPIPDSGPAPDPIDDPVEPDPVTPQTPPACPDYSDEIAALQARIAELENKRVILQTVDTSGRVIQQATAPLGMPIKLRLVPVSPKGQ